MEKYHIGISWTDNVERPFVKALRESTKAKGLSLYEITFINLARDYERIAKKELSFNLFLDRASIDNSIFFLLAENLQKTGVKIINDPESIIKFSSKVNLLEALKGAGIPLPKIRIIDEKTPKKELGEIAEELSHSFAVKPAYGGGVNEILLDAKEASRIEKFIEGKASEPYLVQEFIRPTETLGKTSWWRIIYAGGLIMPFWWDPKTHIYEEFGDSNEEHEIKEKLNSYVKKIAEAVGFELFSSEFAIDSRNNKFLCIDYANQPIDLNTTENTKDGLPKNVVEKIASKIVSSF